jgi:hypothetical protein
MMILAVHLEMIHELQNTLAEDRYLNLWRTGVGLVGSVFCDYFVFGIGRQGHARIDTPRLVLISFFFYSITQARNIGQWERNRPLVAGSAKLREGLCVQVTARTAAVFSLPDTP